MDKEIIEMYKRRMKLSQEVKSKRMHIYAGGETSDKVRFLAEESGLSISDYIICAALSFETESISEKLNIAWEKAKKLASNRKVKTRFISKKEVKELTEQYKKGDTNMAINNTETAKTEQFHIRVSPSVYEEIKAKAASYSMSVSDYVVFIVMHFDIMDISKKIDDINIKLDTLTESTENEA